MEAGTQGWGAVYQNRPRTIPSPWEQDSQTSMPAAAAATGTPLEFAALSPHSSSTNDINNLGYGGYLDSDSASSSPLEALYRRTASLGNLYASGHSPSPSHGHISPQGSPLGFNADGTPRRQSLSGPLPAVGGEYSSLGYIRRPSLSGPLPNSSPSNNPYLSPSDEMPPLVRTPPPWSEFHMKDRASGGTNPYLNPQMFHSPSESVSPSASLSPSSLPRPPLAQSYGGSGSPSPSSAPRPAGAFKLSNGGANAASDPFSTLSPLNSPAGSNSGSPSVPPPGPSSNLSERALSFPSMSGLSLSSENGTSNGDTGKKASPNLTRSRSASTNGAMLNGGSGGGGTGNGVLPFNPKGGGLNRSMSFSGAEKGSIAQKYSKGRGGMGEGVMDSLIAQLVFAQEKPTVLADMIFSPSKGSNSLRGSRGLFAYARDLVERILLAQVHAMAPSFKEMAVRLGELEKETWEANAHKNETEGPTRFPNEGYQLLRLQNQFVEAGLETFDMICRIRKQFPSLLMGEDGFASTGLLRIALFGGGPGCEALGLRLFFMRLLPNLQMQVDIFNRRERWKDIVESISFKGIGYMTVDLFDLVYHPTGLRSYRLLVFLDSLGDGVQRRTSSKGQKFNWEEFWSNLYRNTHAMVVVIIHEKSCPWEEMKPRKGSYWWCSALAEQDQVHVARKM
ncbi:hypothetical protein MPTK1_2g05380 [Marchantia polymorpha subsp. ruderalis]|nr:hypothetical protein MARPO_0031s0192 [Marchantia polymorpha]BBN01190.1 hypothetical protein Mp_2g05380 [Marchantia polymorpha subsp. ruderalis]|eukprot:PTQ42241.1 hypothetical protein MARPO_0031s0192 [Marchantia polymorpha]